MLQQTRIEAAKDYFARFVEEIPDIASLAKVSDERLMKLWEGLGYYNRARNLKKAAVLMVEKYGAELPADYEKLLELPGIGPYTAGAIASISYGIKVPAVDGNVLRVIMRYLKCDEDIAKMPVRRKVETMLLDVMPERPGDFNQAIMELGEVVCIPNGIPLCERCPLNQSCQANACGCQEEYPKKVQKKPRKIEKKTILVFEYEGQIGIARRPEQGLLAGLYEFPSRNETMTLQTVKEYLKNTKIAAKKIQSMGQCKHIFSHVEWHMKGFYIVLEERLEESRSEDLSSVFFVSKESLKNDYALPTAFHYYLEKIL
jgi:A/G-specific adenine glycosylase